MAELPPPGWYDDPTDPTKERWWSGDSWSEQVRAKAPPPPSHRPGDLRPVGDFIGHAFRLLRARWDDLLLLSVITAIVFAVLAFLLARPILDGVEFTETDILGWDASKTWLSGLLIISGGLAGLVALLAIYRLVWEAAVDEPSDWARATRFGVANAPRYLGWTLVALLPMLALGVVIVLMARGLGEAVLLLFFPAAIAFVWWAVAITFLPVSMAADPEVNPIVRSLRITRGRWWRIFGRLFLFGLIAGAISNVVLAIVLQLVPIRLGIESAGEVTRFSPGSVSALDFFIGSFVLLLYAVASSTLQAGELASMAFDVMEGDGVDGEPGEMI